MPYHVVLYHVMLFHIVLFRSYFDVVSLRSYFDVMSLRSYFDVVSLNQDSGCPEAWHVMLQVMLQVALSGHAFD